MRHHDVLQIIGALILCAALACHSIVEGLALLGVLTIVYGVIAELNDTDTPERDE